MARLEIDRLAKAFGAATVFDGLDLHVERGETVAVYGRSGCGKSVLLSILSGALAADGGDLRIDGKSVIDAPPEARDVGMAFQNFALYPHMNAFDNIASPLRGQKKPAREIADKVQAVAALLKIDHVLAHSPQALSNGQRQRTSLARALVAEPAVLLLDDPLRNVDAKLRYEMRLEMPNLFRQFESAVIYVTQDSREAMALADRIAILHDGKFRQIGAPQEVYEFPCTAEVGQLLGDPAINLFACESAARDGALLVNPAGCEVNISGRYDLPAAGKYLAGVRPEDINLAAAPAAPSAEADGPARGIEAVVERITPANVRSLLVASTAAGETITVSLPELAAEQVAPKSRAWLSFPADKLLLFAADSGQLIRPNPPAGG
ncbi:MAG: ABC transporter ATP-binding protein [Gammaproteobacteria bacterium]|nr:ABC transporter ATP-binding protein [Gammaproteobacteria bacterium]